MNETLESDCVSVCRTGEGGVGCAFYHPYEALYSNNVRKLRLKVNSKYAAMFVARTITAQRGKYSYGYNMGTARLKRQVVMLPVDDAGKPDWAFMEEYMRRIEGVLYARYSSGAEECGSVSLDGVQWGEFFISDVAEIISGRGIFDEERQPGNTPYITSSAMNNGVTYFLSNTNETLEANCISVNSNGSVGYAFYHPYEALYSGDCRKLRLHRRNKYAALFIAVQITAQRGKYSYGYKMGTARLMSQKILLPIDETGQPDYAFMEKFIHAHEQRLLHEYISYLSHKLRSTPPPEIT